jgi:hypothetical protein
MSQQQPNLGKHARSSPPPPFHPNKKPSEGPSDGGEGNYSKGRVKDPILPNSNTAVVILDGALGELTIPKDLFWEHGSPVKPGYRVLVYFSLAPFAATKVLHMNENGTAVIYHGKKGFYGNY